MAESTPPTRDQLLTPAAPFTIAWPLTADGLDTDGGNALAPLAANPIASGVGFVANGYDTKLAGDLPVEAQSATAPLAMHVIASAPGPAADWREVVCAVTTTTVDLPKIEIAVVDDPSNSGVGAFQLRTKPASTIVTKYLNRCNWRFEFRAPEQIAQTLVQSLCWLDEDELLFAVDCGTTNVLYRVDATTGEYTGRASSTTYDHINSMHVAPDGSVWCQCQVSGLDEVIQLDLAASFSTGAITEASRWDTGDVPVSSIAFATLGSVEYVLLSQHATSGTPRVYVFQRSQMSGVVNQVDRVTRWRCGYSVQDLAFRPSDGKVYVSRSASAGGATIDSFDLAALLLAADDTTPTPTVASHAPTRWPQGIDFQPAADRAWVGSEGFQNVGDGISHSALWSSALVGPETNAYLVDYTGGSLQVRLNGRLMWESAHVVANAPQKVSVGASPSSTAGLTGFLTAGTVRALAIKSTPFTQTELDDLLVG